jgi:DNA-binding transcriptional regulator YdaS (Cro superfamily)
MHVQAPVAKNSVTRTLALALSTIGSLERLAHYLDVSEQQLEQWMEGCGTPPTRVFTRALDLVAGGPFTRKS